MTTESHRNGTPAGTPRYRHVPEWEQLPPRWEHKDVSDVAVDSQDRVYLLTRYDSRVIVYDRDGSFLRSWGEDMFAERAHGITITPDDTVYVIDEGAHLVRKFTTDGDQIGTIGSGRPSQTGVDASAGDLYELLTSIRCSGGPFNRPTAIAIAPSGDIYVTDGYGNARVHQFSAEGELIRSWGKPGTGPGQFNLPHAVLVIDDQVWVADRENDRLQIFGLDGTFVEELGDFHRPAGLALDGNGLVYVAELPWRVGYRTFRNDVVETAAPGRITIMSREGVIMHRFGNDPPEAPGNLAQPHGVTVDSTGAIYVAEVTWSGAGRFGHVSEDCHTFQKFEPVRRGD